MENLKNVVVALVVIFILCFAATARAQTQGWVEGQGTIAKGDDGGRKVSPTAALMLQKPMGAGIGGFAFASVTKGFGQIYAGPTYSPAKWLELGIGAGLQDNGQFRTGGYAWTGGGVGYVLALGEYSREGGWWYKGIAALRPIKPLAIGGYIQRFAGVGPYVEIKIDNQVLPITLWTSPVMYDQESQEGSRIKSMAGLRAHF